MRGLSVFRGGCTPEAAQAVVNASLRVLTSLAHKSLLRWSWAQGEVGRYVIHELLRQFAAHSLDAAPAERTAAEARHGTYYLAFVAARATELAQAAYGWWQFCLLTGQDPESRHMFGLAVARLRSALNQASTDALSDRQHQRGLSTLLAIHANHLFSNAPYEQMAAEAREAIEMGAASQGLEGEMLGHYLLGRAAGAGAAARGARDVGANHPARPHLPAA